MRLKVGTHIYLISATGFICEGDVVAVTPFRIWIRWEDSDFNSEYRHEDYIFSRLVTVCN